LFLSLVAVALLLQLANWNEVINSLALMEIAWLLPAVLFYLAGVFFRSIAWQTLLQNQAALGRVFLTLNEGYLLNSIFPFRLGEFGRALLLSQASNLSAFFVLSTIIIERAYDLAIAAALLLASIPLVFGMESAQAIASGVIVIVGAGIASLYLLARFRRRIRVRLERLGASNQFYRVRLLPWLDSVLAGLGVLTRLDRFLASVTFILVSWLFGAIEIHLLIASFGISAPWWWTAFALGVVSLGIALPSAPASLGVYEAAMAGALSILGVPPGEALAIAIIAHLIHILFTGLIGTAALFQDGQSITGIYQRLKDARLSGYR
jgi:hypothetical protein